MIVKSYTNDQQSERMIQLGFNPETADFWKTSQVGGYRISTEREVNSKPVWSLGFILGKLDGCWIKDLESFTVKVDLMAGFVTITRGMAIYKDFINSTLIDALLDCYEYLIQNGYEQRY